MAFLFIQDEVVYSESWSTVAIATRFEIARTVHRECQPGYHDIIAIDATQHCGIELRSTLSLPAETRSDPSANNELCKRPRYKVDTISDSRSGYGRSTRPKPDTAFHG